MSRKKRDPQGAGPVDSMAMRVALGRGEHGPSLQLPGLHKIAQDYIQAGVHGADLIQRVINSSGATPAWVRAFLKKHYPAETNPGRGRAI